MGMGVPALSLWEKRKKKACTRSDNTLSVIKTTHYQFGKRGACCGRATASPCSLFVIVGPTIIFTV